MLVRCLQNHTNLQHKFLHMGSTPHPTPPFHNVCNMARHVVMFGNILAIWHYGMLVVLQYFCNMAWHVGDQMQCMTILLQYGMAR